MRTWSVGEEKKGKEGWEEIASWKEKSLARLLCRWNLSLGTVMRVWAVGQTTKEIDAG